MSWILLIVAGLLEVGWAIGLKYTEGFTRLWPSVGTVFAMVASMILLGIAIATFKIYRENYQAPTSQLVTPEAAVRIDSALK